MKYKTFCYITAILAEFYLLNIFIEIIKHNLREMADIFDIDYDFLDDIDIDEID